MLWPSWVAQFNASHASAHGLPLQVLFPFFDVRLVRYVLSTPPTPWRCDKRLLREAMCGRLPEGVRRRPKTPLYVTRGRKDSGHPSYTLAQQAETKRWQRELIVRAPIGEFVDVNGVLARLDAPAPIVSEQLGLQNCVCLAHWLTYGRPSISPPQLEQSRVAD
jgi:asparagine synthase (glutamine-hydrolysing)